MIEEISINTSSRTELIEITLEVGNLVKESKVINGVCYIYTPHTTCGLTINENADPAVKNDVLAKLNKMVPFTENYSHKEGNAAAHIKGSLLGTDLTIFIEGGKLILGVWQGIFFCEFDGPRVRKVFVKIMAG